MSRQSPPRRARRRESRLPRFVRWLPPRPRFLSSAHPRAPLCTSRAHPPPPRSSTRQPKHALKFCHIFPDQSCCLPAQDNEIEEHYFNLLDAGDICAKESSMAKDALKQIFCAACSPKEPDYLYTAGGTTYFKICSSLAKKVAPEQIDVKTGATLRPFDECGMVVVEERGAPCKGDDVVVPSQHWKKCAEGDAVQMRGGDGCDLSGTTGPAGCPASHSTWPTAPKTTVAQPSVPVQPVGTDCTCAQVEYQAVLDGFKSKPEGCGGDYGSCNLKWGGFDCAPARTGVAGYGEAKCQNASSTKQPAAGQAGYEDWRSCSPEYKFINDPSGAKPPFLDDYTMMIVDCEPEDANCNTKCYTGAAARLQVALAAAMLALLSALSLVTV